MASVQRRTPALLGIAAALLLIGALRTLYLATIHSGALRRDAQNQQVIVETIPAPRGTITDRNGVDLAVSEPAEDISATPYLVGDPAHAAAVLAHLLGRPQAQLAARLSERTGFVYLARAVPSALARRVMAAKLAGVEGTPVMHRVYPQGTLAAQVIGALGTEGAGLGGLEYSLGSALGGHAGERRIVSDALGQPVSITDIHREVPGASVSLTLDANIQQRAEQVLAAVGRVFHPQDSTAIVMDPRSGAILAMANWPAADPNDLAGSSPEGLENRAVSFDYEPGSTFKAVTFSAALQEGLITPGSTLNVPDQIQVADRTIHDDSEHPEETLSASQILARSSNVGTIEIGLREGAPLFDRWMQRYGFGAPTGSGLPGEEVGLVPPLARWSGSSMGNLPIGQGESVTPIQMATAYAAIANGGILRAPYVVRSVDGRRRRHAAGRRVISATTAAELREMMRGVLAPGGTASEVSIPGYQLAGKTGTANKVDPATGEYSNSAYVASFVGFAPASDPRLLCAVVVDEPQSGSIYGGTVAAPAFGQIMSFALPYEGVAPEN
ncbi:MAG: penicillin-binding protein 2 [Solirubrobacterales bacterium]|nr:penicillin-binding protein 2 [Solirubrobacterales bacterium]